MKKASVIAGILLVSIFLITIVTAEIRPLHLMNHPGLDNRYMPQEDGANHIGVSDYNPAYTGDSELCEDDRQFRPANQGHNIPQFYSC